MKTVFCVVLLVGLWWWLRKAKHSASSETSSYWRPDAVSATGVHLRMQGERGMGGPVYGDVLCDGGVYLSYVWEMDFQTSTDGRWLLRGDYDSQTPYVVDREARCVWVLSSAALNALRERIALLPTWSKENEASGGAQSLNGQYASWLADLLGNAGQPLVALKDLWLRPEDVPDTRSAVPLNLPQHAHPAVHLEVQRLQPTELRYERYPLETWIRVDWQVVLDGQTTPWVLDSEVGGLTWRADGRAFACYGYSIQAGARGTALQLLVWSVQHGWQAWEASQPEDRKPWSVSMVLFDASHSAMGNDMALQWEGDVLLQRMYTDTPGLERLHDGRSISCTMSEIDGCVGHSPDGLPQLAPVPSMQFWWRKDLAHPLRWSAQSDPVAGQSLHWTLAKEAPDMQGATVAYTLRWGNTQLPGLWELEHVIVQGRWALLRPWGQPVEQGGNGAVVVWDGVQVQAVALPWPVLRLRPKPWQGEQRAGVSVMVRLGMAENQREHASTGYWRWSVQDALWQPEETEGLSAVYAWRDLSPNAQGRWQLQDNWRSVSQAQHPCADGDYVWNLEDGHDGLWWWGGLNMGINSYWDREEVRIEGVCMTRSGTALCGVGPHALAHPDGDGWWVLEHLERDYSAPHHWLLHWLRPAAHEVLSVSLRAYVPVLGVLSERGLLWTDAQPAAPNDGEAWPQHGWVGDADWSQALRTPLVQVETGLWMRQQDIGYAQALRMQQDCPW